tara:strand:+ start:62 stop:721 length:660 start_codon:yes stop_codon:yes gene_type:complete
MERLVDLIKVYDNALDDYTCEYLTEHFERSKRRHKKVSRNRTPNFTEYNLTRNVWREDRRTKKVYTDLVNKIDIHAQEYFNFVNHHFKYLFPDDIVYARTVFPAYYGIERFRIKRYNVGVNEAFNTHVDSMNLLSCPRFISFLWYLNDVEEGGQTLFHGKEVKPKKGRLVIFPPLWLFPHMGTEPISNTKYVMSSYLRYNMFTNSKLVKIIGEMMRRII